MPLIFLFCIIFPLSLFSITKEELQTIPVIVWNKASSGSVKLIGHTLNIEEKEMFDRAFQTFKTTPELEAFIDEFYISYQLFNIDVERLKAGDHLIDGFDMNLSLLLSDDAAPTFRILFMVDRWNDESYTSSKFTKYPMYDDPKPMVEFSFFKGEIQKKSAEIVGIYVR